MKQRDIMELIDAITPSIAASFLKATESLVQRVAQLEKDFKEATDHKKEIVIPSAEEIAKLVPAGKDADPVEIVKLIELHSAAHVAALTDELKAVTAVEIEKAVKEIPPAVPGKDADPDLIEVLVAEYVEKAVKEIPPAAPGKDADPDLIKAMVEKAVKEIPPAAPGKDADPHLVESLVSEYVEKAIKELPPADPGPPGNDASLEQIANAVETALMAWERPKNGESVTVEQVAPLIEETVAKHIAKIPIPKDGVGLAGGMIDRAGSFILTMTDGTTRDLGNVLGKDGMGFDNLDVIDNSDEFVLRLKSGDHLKVWPLRKPTIADFYKGVWTAGLHARGTLVTWGGSLWMAQRDTEIKPETKDNDDWKLVVKRGRDGKDFTPVGGKS